MPIPTGFDNKVVVVSPITATDLNTALTTLNAAGYWVTDLRLSTSGDALLLACKTNTGAGAYGYTADQKVNLVDIDQTALDADKATETGDGYWPTGIFIDPADDTQVFVLYSQLEVVALP